MASERTTTLAVSFDKNQNHEIAIHALISPFERPPTVRRNLSGWSFEDRREHRVTSTCFSKPLDGDVVSFLVGNIRGAASDNEQRGGTDRESTKRP
jgi:hypothetical protein